MRYFPLLFFLFTLLFSACTATSVEPSSEDNFDVATVAVRTTNTPRTIAPTRTPQATSTPEFTPTPAPPTPVFMTPTPTMNAMTATAPPPTPTPLTALPGMMLTSEQGLWSINEQWQPEHVSTITNVLDVNGRNVLFMQDDDIWLWNMDTDVQTNISNTANESECDASFWDGYSYRIIYQQRLSDGSGFCSGPVLLHDTQSGETSMSGHIIMADVAGSPDGRFLAYDINGTELQLYDVEQETVISIDPAEYGFPQDTQIERLGAPSWSPDNQQLAVIMAVQAPDAPRQIILGIFDLANKRFAAHHPYQNLGRDGWFPPAQWHPNGEWIAFIAEDVNMSQFGVWVINPTNGEEKLIPMAFNPLWSPDGQWLYYQFFDTEAQLTQSFLTYPPDFTYQIGVTLPVDAQLIAWE